MGDISQQELEEVNIHHTNHICFLHFNNICFINQTILVSSSWSIPSLLSIANIFITALTNDQAFKLFDADGDGKINGEELKALVNKVSDAVNEDDDDDDHYHYYIY